MPSMIPWGEDDRNFYIWLPPDSILYVSFFANFNLNPLPVINREYNSLQ